MRKFNLGKSLTALMLVWTMLMLPMLVIGQTRIKMPKNKYKIQDDVKIGRETSIEVEKQFPVLNDSTSTRYVQDVGQRLVRAIPAEFQQPAFEYNFKIVNASDINAFALPGGPMYVNRGMIESSRNEGEMAGVMAHELSHVALRHGTSQATKQNSVGTQLGVLGAILGGAILGGQAGAQLGMLGAQAWLTKYSREYETQADILGAQILANAGYDPHDLANMFKTLEEQGGSRGPEWLSSHPNPGNRFERINREADLLRISPEPIKLTREFEQVQARLRSMPRARTMAEIEKDAQGRQGQSPSGSTMSRGTYNSRVSLPSSQTKTYSSGDTISLRVPNNWTEFPNQTEIWFAPEGAYGNQGITHGAMLGSARTNTNDLAQATENYVDGILQSNNYLSKRTGYSRAYISGRNGYAITLSGTSPVTRRTELVTVYTTQLRNGNLFYVVTVSPESESRNYDYAFRNLIRSIRLNA